MVFNYKDCGTFRPLFPISPSRPTQTLSEDGFALLVQAIPVSTVIFFWAVSYCHSKRRPSTHFFQAIAFFLAVSSFCAQTILLWHTFDILECEGLLTQHYWQPIAVSAHSVTVVALLYFMAVAADCKVVTVAFVALASLALAADWMLRGGITTGDASHLFVALQQMYAIQVVSSLHFHKEKSALVAPTVARRRHPSSCPGVPRGTETTPHTQLQHAASLPPIDSLASRLGSQPRNAVPGANQVVPTLRGWRYD